MPPFLFGASSTASTGEGGGAGGTAITVGFLAKSF